MMQFATVKGGPRAGMIVHFNIHRNSPACRVDMLDWQKRGLTYTSTGYGAKIPTQYKVRTIDNKWRCVYCTVYSNAGTCWIVQNGEKISVSIS